MHAVIACNHGGNDPVKHHLLRETRLQLQEQDAVRGSVIKTASLYSNLSALLLLGACLRLLGVDMTMKLTLHCDCGATLTEELAPGENELLKCEECDAKIVCTTTQIT